MMKLEIYLRFLFYGDLGFFILKQVLNSRRRIGGRLKKIPLDIKFWLTIRRNVGDEEKLSP